jgi:hypothetical protein
LPQANELIPVDEPTVLRDSTFYKDLFKEEPKLKMQHEFTDISTNLCYKNFLKHFLSHHAITSEKSAIRAMDPAGVFVHSIVLLGSHRKTLAALPKPNSPLLHDNTSCFLL